MLLFSRGSGYAGYMIDYNAKILAILENAERPLTAGEIFERMGLKHKRSAPWYNNLWRLSRNNVVTVHREYKQVINNAWKKPCWMTVNTYTVET